MKIRKVTAAFFSPGGNVEKIAIAIGRTAAEMLEAEFEMFDFLPPGERDGVRNFDSDEFLIIGLPVFAGRLPNKILPFVQSGFRAAEASPDSSALCIPFVSFGNRSFDDGLSELVMEMRNSGFEIAGAAAVVGQHSFCETLAPGRPDEKDMEEIKNFSRDVCRNIISIKDEDVGSSSKETISAIGSMGFDKTKEGSKLVVPGNTPPGPYYTPLREDGERAVFLKAKPLTDAEKCDGCMDCANRCPMGSISQEDPSEVPGICIKCQACIKVCHADAKYFDDPDFLSHRKFLDSNHKEEKRNLFVLTEFCSF